MRTCKDWFDVGRGRADKSPEALHAKIDLREHVLAEVPEARVLDLYCGAERQMYEGAWKQAASWVGCDARPWVKGEPARFVCDNRLLLRAIDLSAYNVFDFDAYGSPWDAMLILAARRRWTPGERGAVVMTDATKATAGGMPQAVEQLVGMERIQPGVQLAQDLQGLLWRAWTVKAGVQPVRMWIAQGRRASKRGRSGELYTAVVFEGTGVLQ